MDDQPEARRLIYHALKHRYRVLEAGDADSAIALVEREPVDLVLLDLHLPPRPESPAEGLRAQRRMAELARDLPVVGVSSNETPELREALLRGGARQFLAKPLNAGVLEQVVRGLLAEPK